MFYAKVDGVVTEFKTFESFYNNYPLSDQDVVFDSSVSLRRKQKPLVVARDILSSDEECLVEVRDRAVKTYKLEKPPAYIAVVVRTADKVELLVKEYFEGSDMFTCIPHYEGDPKERLAKEFKVKADILTLTVDESSKVHIATVDLKKGEALPTSLSGFKRINLGDYVDGTCNKLMEDQNLVWGRIRSIVSDVLRKFRPQAVLGLWVKEGEAYIHYKTVNEFIRSEHFKTNCVLQSGPVTSEKEGKPEDIFEKFYKERNPPSSFNVITLSEQWGRNFTSARLQKFYNVCAYQQVEAPAYNVMVVQAADKVRVIVDSYFNGSEELIFRPVLKGYNQHINLGYLRKRGIKGKAKKETIIIDGKKIHLTTVDASKVEDLDTKLERLICVDLTKYRKGQENKFVTAISEKIAKAILDRMEDL